MPKSQLIIGCKKCFQEIKNKKGYLLNNKGLMRIPIVVHTAYTINDLYELFFEGYTCPFCQNEFIITPKVMLFANDFIDKNYHIIFRTDSIEFINKHEKLEISLDMDIEEMKQVLSSFNYDSYNFPLPDEIEIILNAVNDIDLLQWDIYIQSKHIEPFYEKHQYK
jgi:hypothetical protein